MKSLSYITILVIYSLTTLVACGIKGPPLPPLPQEVKDPQKDEESIDVRNDKREKISPTNKPKQKAK